MRLNKLLALLTIFSLSAHGAATRTLEASKISGIQSETNYVKQGDAEQAHAASLWSYYSEIFTATISNASPAVVTATAHGLREGDALTFTTSGALPTGLSSSPQTIYYAKNVAANTFNVSATRGGAAINTSSAGSGTHTVRPLQPLDGIGGVTTAGFTIARVTSGALAGSASLQLAKASVSGGLGSTATVGHAGDGMAQAFTIDPADQGKLMKFEFDYSVVSGSFDAGTSTTDGSMTVWIYDVTNSMLIQPSTYKITNGLTNAKTKFVGVFQTSGTSTSYRVLLHNSFSGSNTSAYSLNIDNLSIGPMLKTVTAPATDWVSYTPTIGASSAITSLGNGSLNGRWRRVGDTMEVDVHFTWGTTTSGSGNPYKFSIPAGYSIDTTKAASDNLGHALYSDIGTGGYNGVVIRDSDPTLLRIFGDSALGAWNGTGVPAVPAATDTIQIRASFPIVGWSSNMSAFDVDAARPAVLVVNVGGNQSIPNSSDTLLSSYWSATATRDTHGAWDGTNKRWIAPASGDYWVLARVAWTASGSATARDVIFRVNSVAVPTSFRDIGVNLNYHQVQATGILTLKAGDIVDVLVRQESGSSLTALGDSVGAGQLVISRVGAGNDVVGAGEAVAVSVYRNANTASLTNNTDTAIVFDVEDIDTHGAYNNATGDFTAPVAGLYDVSSTLRWPANGTGLRAVRLYKNAAWFSTIALCQPSTGNDIQCGSDYLVRLNAGDVLGIRGLQTSGGGLVVQGTGVERDTRLNIKKVGN